jgi:hypothetical protein
MKGGVLDGGGQDAYYMALSQQTVLSEYRLCVGYCPDVDNRARIRAEPSQLG